MKNLHSLIVISIFCAIISFPIIAKTFNLEFGLKNRENRELAKLPVFEYSNIFFLPSQYNSYFDDNFGFRRELIRFYNILKVYILKTTPLTDKHRGVLLGKDGWFFINTEYIKKDLMNETFFDNEQLEILSEKIGKRRKRLKKLGIDYIIYLAPNNHTIYPEKLPYYFPEKQSPSNLDRVLEVIDDKDEFIIDGRIGFMKAKDDSIFYYRTDSHWNKLGAFSSYQSIIKNASIKHPDLRQDELTYKDFQIMEVAFENGELTRMLDILNFETETETILEPIIPYSFIQIKEEGQPNYGLNTTFMKNDSAKNNLKAFLIGDSFIKNIRPYLAQNFRELVSMQHHKLSLEVMKKEKPNVLIHIIPERNIGMLLVGD